MEELFKHEGTVNTNGKVEELSIPVKPGKYIVTVKNSKSLIGNSNLSAVVTCDSMLNDIICNL